MAFAESHGPTSCSSFQKMKKFSPVPGGERLVHQESWTKLFVDLVKRRGSDVCCKQRPPAHLIQDFQQSSFTGSGQTDERKVRSNRQALDEPSAHDKCGDQARIAHTHVDTSKDKRRNSAEKSDSRTRLSPTSKTHVLENPLPPRKR